MAQTEDGIYVASPPRWKRIALWLKKEWLLLATVLCVILGITLALALRTTKVDEDVLNVVKLPGYIFMSLMKMLVLPIMISSVISGSATLTGKTQGKVAITTISYFVITSFISSLIGLVLVVSVHPGSSKIRDMEVKDLGIGDYAYHTRILDTLLDMIRNAFPDNLVQACFRQEYTKYEETIKQVNESEIVEMNKMVSKRLGVNSLGLITFCAIFGVSMGAMGEQAMIMKQFFIALDRIVMRLALTILYAMPLGVISLITANFLQAGDIVLLINQLALFMVTVFLGLGLELFGLQPLLYWIVTKKNPFKYMWHCLEAAITAFGVSSSSAALPVTLRCVEEKCKVDSRISRFVIPIGVTVNMDGTALFITVATIFIAQINNVTIGAGEVIALLLTATAVSIATSSVPSASIFLMVMTLSVVGAPVEDISFIVAMEWILDRSRTVNNVMGDAFACGIVNHICQEELEGAAPPPTEFEMEPIPMPLPRKLTNPHIHSN